jgi:hypothetical protein
MYAYFLGSKLRYRLAGTYSHLGAGVPKEISPALKALLDTRADAFPGRRVAYIGSKRKVSKASRTMSMFIQVCQSAPLYQCTRLGCRVEWIFAKRRCDENERRQATGVFDKGTGNADCAANI